MAGASRTAPRWKIGLSGFLWYGFPYLVERECREDPRAFAARRDALQPPVERRHPVDEAPEAGPIGGIRAPGAVIRHDHRHLVARLHDLDERRRGAGILRHVRQGLR